jgi:hypothetical protein
MRAPLALALGAALLFSASSMASAQGSVVKVLPKQPKAAAAAADGP